MIEIKILGGGCAKCDRLEAVTRAVVNELGVQANFTKIKRFSDIMAYDVMITPALVIDEKVVSSGRIPEHGEIKDWLLGRE